MQDALAELRFLVEFEPPQIPEPRLVDDLRRGWRLVWVGAGLELLGTLVLVAGIGEVLRIEPNALAVILIGVGLASLGRHIGKRR